MGRLDGKVAFVTGAARGQGRSHAVELAREGADVIAVDIAHDLPDLGLAYQLGSAEELAVTAAEVRALGRRIITAECDVRDAVSLGAALAAGVAEFGRLDIVAANAGIGANPTPAHDTAEDAWAHQLDVNLTGVWKTCSVAIPHLVEAGRGGSIILTSSMAGLRGYRNMASYSAAKHGVVGLMRSLAAELAEHSIRVNSVHPTQVDTPMLMNDAVFQAFRPDLEHPTRDDFAVASQNMHALPLPWVESVDVSRAVLFLASEDARYITGVALPIDAGLLIN
ncbi:mycofactocin-coupled SDR family oxidoreductase [Rhodococcoides yunnanense]|uniref:mycofactocin-coupled SDR family oxidoreductase n=1 Tax=Rhodococcoides yunnanense TaxID=278209 RepID=UPI00093282C9|nr:mycofactocin-coupled SDR family oxidoreductase [Rhodococcus yunnanensis]